MKNMFGIVPGLKYGWPKNILHWKGIHESILDICASAPIQLVIADGIMGMEGNGPLHGEKKNLGVIVIGDDPVAADATVARLMGLRPERVQHLLVAGGFLGNLHPKKIWQLGEPVGQLRQIFRVPPGFSYLSSEVDSWQVTSRAKESPISKVSNRDPSDNCNDKRPDNERISDDPLREKNDKDEKRHPFTPRESHIRSVGPTIQVSAFRRAFGGGGMPRLAHITFECASGCQFAF
jgi:hypothetical protein